MSALQTIFTIILDLRNLPSEVIKWFHSVSLPLASSRMIIALIVPGLGKLGVNISEPMNVYMCWTDMRDNDFGTVYKNIENP